MINSDLVSVIIPVYNVDKYLEKCIDSILNQTYKKIEIILVDDGSTDTSGHICDRYKEKNNNIIVIHKKNEGLGYARNSALKIASGKYVTFIDSDDYADSDLIMNLIKATMDDNVDTCIGGFKKINNKGKIEFIEKYQECIYTNNNIYDSLFARMLGSLPEKHDALRMSVWNVLYSMKIIKEHSLMFPSERDFISEDIIWDSEYYKYAHKVKIIESTAYNYRTTPGSLTQKFKPQRFEKTCILYKELKKRIGNDSTKVIRLQRQFFVNLRVCLKQEQHKISNNNCHIYKIRVRKIINDDLVQKIVKEYPIDRIQIKQKIFLLLIKYKLSHILIIFINLGII